MEMQKGIELKLSCYCCGGTVFENNELPYTKIEDDYYLLDEDSKDCKLKCVNCGLEDYIGNLVPKAEYRGILIE